VKLDSNEKLLRDEDPNRTWSRPIQLSTKLQPPQKKKKKTLQFGRKVGFMYQEGVGKEVHMDSICKQRRIRRSGVEMDSEDGDLGSCIITF